MLRTVAFLALIAPGACFAFETMRIAMADGVNDVRFSAQVLSVGADSDDAAFRVVPNGRATVRLAQGHLELDGEPVVGDSVRFRSGAWALDAGVPGQEPLRAGQSAVRGDVVVRLHAGGLQLVNVVSLEDYLVAVLGSEMPPGFPDEALKAQAVAARTYALRRKIETYGEAFHMGADVLSQVYGGLSHEDARARAAVQATRGQVLTYELEPIEAYFHSSCGGRTESGLAALNRDLPYLKSVDCPCGALSSSRWELTVSWADLRRATGALEPRSFAVASRTSTGRVRRVALGSGRTMDAVLFRQRLGYGRLKSLNFELEPLPREQGVRFSGRGSGHGAGLCQWGAKAFADQGRGYREILAHYYPGTELQTLY